MGYAAPFTVTNVVDDPVPVGRVVCPGLPVVMVVMVVMVVLLLLLLPGPPATEVEGIDMVVLVLVDASSVVVVDEAVVVGSWLELVSVLLLLATVADVEEEVVVGCCDPPVMVKVVVRGCETVTVREKPLWAVWVTGMVSVVV